MRKRRRDMKVMVRGVVYDDAYAVAEAFGVSVDTVYSAVSKGRADSIGVGKGGRRSQQGGGRKPKPVVVAGIAFESRAALARAIGRRPHNVVTALSRSEESRARIVRDVMRLFIAKQENEALEMTKR